MEEKRLALVGIIVEDSAAAERVNAILHDYGDYVAGRMGLPYRTRGVNIISVVLDAPPSVINGLTGKLGMVESVSAKALYSGK